MFLVLGFCIQTIWFICFFFPGFSAEDSMHYIMEENMNRGVGQPLAKIGGRPVDAQRIGV